MHIRKVKFQLSELCKTVVINLEGMNLTWTEELCWACSLWSAAVWRCYELVTDQLNY